jgi:glycosyltransferase involved in cell wall biosynthesis
VTQVSSVPTINPYGFRQYSAGILPENKSIGFSIKRFIKKVAKTLPDPLKDLIRFLRRPLTKDIVIFLKFVIRYFYWSGLRPLRFIPKASLYYLHAPYLFPAVYLLSRIYRVPFIYDAHDFYTRDEESSERSRINRRWFDPFYRKIEALCINHAAAVVTTSEGYAKLQEQAFGVRSIVIRNCEDLRLEISPPQHLRQVIGLSSKEFLIVIIGQAKKGMAVHEAFEALLQLPSWVHLALVGKNQDQYLEEVVKYELRNRVHLIQPVKPFEVISFIKSADASLIPYYARSVNYENALPNRLFQSIGAELPIFYPELPEIRKLVEAYEIGIPIDPLVPESIVQAAIKLIDNPALRLQYHANVRRAKDDLNWEKEEVILRDLVLKVLKHG